jgi:hypothetical protein
MSNPIRQTPTWTAAVILVVACDSDVGSNDRSNAVARSAGSDTACQTLRDKGFEVSLNIVGFAIDDLELTAQFEEFAISGGEQHVAAKNETDLTTRSPVRRQRH